jgi:hypothetical protein
VRALRPVGLGVVLAALVASAPAQAPAPPTPEELRSNERATLLAIQTVLLAGRTYAASNGGLFDELRCLGEPWSCIPGYPKDGASFLDPTYDWLTPQLGYVRKFHAGPPATLDEIARAQASSTSLKAFAYTATPLQAGQGQRGLCGDSKGRLCMTRDGSEPPVKNGLCEPCRKLE